MVSLHTTNRSLQVILLRINLAPLPAIPLDMDLKTKASIRTMPTLNLLRMPVVVAAATTTPPLSSHLDPLLVRMAALLEVMVAVHLQTLTTNTPTPPPAVAVLLLPNRLDILVTPINLLNLTRHLPINKRVETSIQRLLLKPRPPTDLNKVTLATMRISVLNKVLNKATTKRPLLLNIRRRLRPNKSSTMIRSLR